jgi:hypothetical protein
VARLIYSAIASLDGYVADEDGNFGWAAPDEEVHAFVNDLERPVGTYLYGRRMYETMVFWETVDTGPEQHQVMRDFAEIWRTADKVVYSRTLGEASSAKTRIEREFDPGTVPSWWRRRAGTSASAGPSLRLRRSERAWSTSASCSSPQWWSAPASGRFPTASSHGSSCSTSAVSTAASSISATT